MIIALYQQHKKHSDVYKAFGDTKLCNPSQVATLFLQEGRAEVREKLNDSGESTGDYETVLTIDISGKDGDIETLTGTPDELFGKWINQNKNSHHVKNDLAPGGGSYSKNNFDVSSEDVSKLSPTEKLKYARQHN